MEQFKGKVHPAKEAGEKPWPVRLLNQRSTESERQPGNLPHALVAWSVRFFTSKTGEFFKKAKFQELLNSNELDGEDEYIDVQESESSDTDEQCHSPSEVDINSFNDKEEECPEELQDNGLENASCLDPKHGKKAVPVNASLGSKRTTGKKTKISNVTGKEKWERKSSDGDEELKLLKELVSCEKESKKEVKLPPSAKEKDDDALFGDLVASQLRKLPEMLKLQARHQINGTMFHMQMRMHQQQHPQQQPVNVVGYSPMNNKIQSPVPEYDPRGPFQRSLSQSPLDDQFIQWTKHT